MPPAGGEYYAKQWEIMRLGPVLAAVAAGVVSLVPVTVPAGAAGPVGALRVCTTGDYAPYSIADGHGGYRGIDIDLANGLGGLLRRPVEFESTTWSTLAADFGAKNCDIAVGGISESASRRAFSDFSMEYGTDGKTPIVRAADAGKYATIDQIDRPGVRVVVNPGGTNGLFDQWIGPDATA